MHMNTILKIADDAMLDELWHSQEYADYIIANCGGERIVCNGDTLIDAQEDNYMFDSFLESIGFQVIV